MSLQGPVWKAARALFAADTGASGLNNSASAAYVSAFNYQRAPQQQARPYIVFTTVADRSNDGKAVDIQQMRVAFNIYTDADSSAPSIPVYAIMARVRTVFHRIAATSTIAGIDYKVWFQRASGQVVPESESVFHHAEVYNVMVTGQ